MAEYIEREAAVSVIEAKQKEICPVGRYGRGYVYGTDREKYDNWEEIIDALENINAADVVPVVRCWECKHLNGITNEKLYAHCPKTNTFFFPFQLDTRTHFCSLGERSTDNSTEK